ncbi:MAG: YlxR family protein [Chloroflexi bacterium]|nr:MAG: YlxR family protein [Chloroflexota bacterium]TMD64689.1 MAG: YlxR family protein [Chloroflexota bacterium]
MSRRPRRGRAPSRRLAAKRPEPERTCVGCHQVKPRTELHRLSVADGAIAVNPRRVSGRSAYLCHDPACWAAAQKRRALDRALQVRSTPQDWERLRQGILN